MDQANPRMFGDKHQKNLFEKWAVVVGVYVGRIKYSVCHNIKGSFASGAINILNWNGGDV